MSDSFYVVLNSQDSTDIYAQNKMANFKSRLAKRLELDGEWETALVRFSFTNSLCTFHEPQIIYLCASHHRQAAFLIGPQKFRDIGHLITVINKSVENEVNISETDELPILKLDHNNRVIEVYAKIGQTLYHLEFSPQLEIILGLERKGCHFLDAFRTDVYIYLDIIDHKIVGDATVPLLTTVDIGNMATDRGDQFIYKIKKPEYAKIVQSTVDEIEVQILNDTGVEPLFEFGNVSLTLHIRKKK